MCFVSTLTCGLDIPGFYLSFVYMTEDRRVHVRCVVSIPLQSAVCCVHVLEKQLWCLGVLALNPVVLCSALDFVNFRVMSVYSLVKFPILKSHGTLQRSVQFSKRWNSIILHLPGRKKTLTASLTSVQFGPAFCGLHQFFFPSPVMHCSPIFPSTQMHITVLGRYVWVERKSQSSAGSTQGRCCWPLEQMDKGKLWSWQ